MEHIAPAVRSRIITGLFPSLAEVERLRLIGAGISQELAELEERINHLAQIRAELVEAQRQNAEHRLTATTGFDALFLSLLPAAEPVEGKKRGRKGRDAAVAVVEVAADPCKACHSAAGCDDCCKDCLSGCDTKQACRKSGEVQGQQESATDQGLQGVADAADPAQKEAEGGETEDAGMPAALDNAAAEQTAFMPLDEPLGDCELCMGYGIIEGELYGEPTMVPCTCDAGKKAQGGVVASRCDDCNIENPDCASCHPPDMGLPFEADPAPEVKKDEPCKHHWREINPKDMSESCKDCGFITRPGKAAELAKCFNGACTATGPDAKGVCLRIGELGCAPQDCKNFKAEPASESKLQNKCPHPRPFREQTADGVRCKVCQTIIEPAAQAA